MSQGIHVLPVVARNRECDFVSCFCQDIFVIAVFPDNESLYDVVESVAFCILIGFSREFVGAFGGIVHHTGEDDRAACREGPARPVTVKR